MDVVFHEGYDFSASMLAGLVPFDTNKHSRIAGYLGSRSFRFHRPDVIAREHLLLVHTPAHIDSLVDPGVMASILENTCVRHIPQHTVRDGILRPFLLMTGGTLLTAKLAMKHGIAANLGGGLHHAQPRFGSGFCPVNDIAVAIRVILRDGMIRRAVVIDTDSHQGNGTAATFADEECVFTFSLHEDQLYPIPKAKSDLDVSFNPGMCDDRYLELLSHHLPHVLDLHIPDIAFHVAGSDMHADDAIANGMMTSEGISQRDELIMRECMDRGIPYVQVLAGGYFTGSAEVHAASLANLAKIMV
jgi:histone deacetylase 11